MLPKSLRPLLPYLRKYRGQYAVGTLCVLLNNGIWIAFPQIIRYAVDDLNRGVTRHKLGIYSLLLVGAAVTKGVFQFLTRWVVIGISREIEFDLRNDLFQHLESLSYSYYQRTRTGDVMARATNDLNAVRMLLGPAIMYSANTLVFTAGALFFMLAISPKLTLYAFLPLPVVSIVVQYFGKQIHERFERIQAMFSDISARVQENFSGARVIRAYVQEQAEINAFESANREYIARSLRLVRLMGMLWPTLEFMLGLAIVLAFWLGAREVLLGRMTLGGYVAFLQYLAQLTWPVIALGWVINIFSAAPHPWPASTKSWWRGPTFTIVRNCRPAWARLKFRYLRRFKAPLNSAILTSLTRGPPFCTTLTCEFPLAPVWPSWGRPVREKQRWSA